MGVGVTKCQNHPYVIIEWPLSSVEFVTSKITSEYTQFHEFMAKLL